MCSNNFAPDCSQGEHVGYKHIPEKKDIYRGNDVSLFTEVYNYRASRSYSFTFI